MNILNVVVLSFVLLSLPFTPLCAKSYVPKQLIIKPTNGAYTQLKPLATKCREWVSTTNFIRSKRQLSFKPHQHNTVCIYHLNTRLVGHLRGKPDE